MPDEPTSAEELLEGQDFESEGEEETPAPEEPTGDPPAETPGGDEPAEPESTEEPEAAAPSFVDQLSELGFQDLEDENQARERLLSSYQQLHSEAEQLRQQQAQLQQFATYGQQYLAELQQRQQQQPAQGEPEQKPGSWWNPPKFEQQWVERYREVDPETGQVKWKEDTPAEVISGSQAYQQYVEDWADGLTRRPNEVLPPIIEQTVKPLFEQWYEQRRSAETEQDFVSRLKQDNDWLFETDPRTNQPTERLSQDGRQVMSFVDEAANMGIGDPRQQWEYATKMYRLQALESDDKQRSRSDSAKATAKKKRSEHLQRAAGAGSIPSRGGSRRQVEDPPRPQNRNVSPGQHLVDDLVADGVLTD